MFAAAQKYLLLMFFSWCLICAPGCRLFQRGQEPQQAVVPPGSLPNPLPVPPLARELVMDEVSDEIDDYLPILKEERIRNVDGILSEGWIETRPKIGSSIFAPWQRDSTPGFQKQYATLQTVRRFAKVRIIPTAENYLVDLRVYLELEDLQQPIGSPVVAIPLRNHTLRDIDFNERFEVPNSGWIPMGRDFSLEQRILQGIQGRFAEAARQSNVEGCEGEDCGPQQRPF